MEIKFETKDLVLMACSSEQISYELYSFYLRLTSWPTNIEHGNTLQTFVVTENVSTIWHVILSEISDNMTLFRDERKPFIINGNIWKRILIRRCHMNITECDYLQFKDQCLIGEGKFSDMKTYYYQFFATRETLGSDTLDITLIFLKKFGYPFPEVANTNPYKENKIRHFLEGNSIWSRFLKH